VAWRAIRLGRSGAGAGRGIARPRGMTLVDRAADDWLGAEANTAPAHVAPGTGATVVAEVSIGLELVRGTSRGRSSTALAQVAGARRGRATRPRRAKRVPRAIGARPGAALGQIAVAGCRPADLARVGEPVGGTGAARARARLGDVAEPRGRSADGP